MSHKNFCGFQQNCYINRALRLFSENLQSFTKYLRLTLKPRLIFVFQDLFASINKVFTLTGETGD